MQNEVYEINYKYKAPNRSFLKKLSTRFEMIFSMSKASYEYLETFHKGFMYLQNIIPEKLRVLSKF